MTNPTRACIVCGTDISSRHGNATRCVKCRRLPAKTKTQLTATCKHCGEFFGDKLGRTAGNILYCGPTCAAASRAATATECRFDACVKVAKYNGLCSGHAEQARRGRELTPLKRQRKCGEPCDFGGCLKLAHSAGLCEGHFEQKRRGRNLAPLRPRKPSDTHSKRDNHGRKFCPACKRWLPVNRYHARLGKADGLHYECKACTQARRRLRVFGISSAQYAEMLEGQGGGCAICKVAPSPGRVLAVDHDHTCCPGNRSCGDCVRGLLCSACNTSIGAMRDDPGRLMGAAHYLMRSRDGERSVA